MKNVRFLLVIFTFTLIFTGVNSAQENAIKSNIEKLFKFSKDKDYKSASALILYRGDNAERNFKTALNFSDEGEQRDAKRITKRIKAFLDLSDGYEFGELTSENENGRDYSVITVNFKSGGQTLKTSFAFVNVSNKYLLADID